MSSYPIDTLENSSIIEVSDRNKRKSINEQGWEFTDRPVLLAPIGAGTSITPIFSWDKYVKDIPIENPIYRLEVTEKATTGEAPDWTDPHVRMTEETSKDLREVLNAGSVYDWRVFAYNRTMPEMFIDHYERAELGENYEGSLLQGTGGVSDIQSDSFRVGADGTSTSSRQATKLLQNFENPTFYLRGIRFTSVAPDAEFTVYFNTLGDFGPNFQQDGYYLYIFNGNEFRLGKVVGGTPADKQSRTFDRVADTFYDFKFQIVNGRIRITPFLSGDPEPSQPLFDWTDPDTPYLSGGVSFVQYTGNSIGGFAYTLFNSFEATFAEGEATIIDSVTVNGSTSNLEEGKERSVSADVEGSGNVQQSVSWAVTSGPGTIEATGNNTAVYTAPASVTSTEEVTITATSTQDGTKTGTLTFNVVEESVDTSDDSVQGDFDALMAIYNNTQGDDLDVLNSTNDLPSLSEAEYPFMYKINGEIHYIEFDRDGSRKSWENAGAPWKDTTGWLNMEPSTMEHAVGVEVDAEGRVIAFDMQKVTTVQFDTAGHQGYYTDGNNLCGVLPPEVGNLKRCKKFNIKQNFFYGPLPPEFGLIGSAMERLSLAGHHWEAAIDRDERWHEAAHLHYIKSLDDDPTDIHSGWNKRVRDTNRFRSELPPEWGNLSNLDLIELTWQFLQGTLPSNWGNLTNLRGLLMMSSFSSSNTIGGSIPASWGNMTKMRYFKISQSQTSAKYSGALPAGMEDWDDIVDFDIGRNNFSSGIPHFNNVRNLYYYSVGNNNFSEPFPWESIFYEINGNRQNDRLDKFSVANSGFTGTIHSKVYEYPNMAALYVNDNDFEGHIESLHFNTTIFDCRRNSKIVSHEKYWRHNRNIRTLRMSHCSLSCDLMIFDWYNFHNQRTGGHPLRNFRYFRLEQNDYTESQLNAQMTDLDDNKYPWEDQPRGAFWYFQNKFRNDDGTSNIITNVLPGFTKSQYINAGFSSDIVNNHYQNKDGSGNNIATTGYEWMHNMLRTIAPGGVNDQPGGSGPGGGWQEWGL